VPREDNFAVLQEIILGIRDIFKVIRTRILFIITITLLAALATGLYSNYYMKPIYESKISIVIGKTMDINGNSQYDYNDIMMYQNLVKTYADIAQSRTVAMKAIEKLGYGDSITPEMIRDKITVTLKPNTQIIDLMVKDMEPEKSTIILNSIVASFIEESTRIYPNGNIQTIDEAVVPKTPVSPNVALNIIIASLLGLIMSIGLSFTFDHLDNTIKGKNDIDRYIGLPVMGIIPKRFIKWI
jgi:capsular polysaccharide biosynthesis protein